MIDAQILGNILGLDTATAQRLFAVATAMVRGINTAKRCSRSHSRDESHYQGIELPPKDGAPHGAHFNALKLVPMSRSNIKSRLVARL